MLPSDKKELKTLMRTRDRLNKAAVKSKSPALMRSYRKARNTTDTLNIQLMNKHYNDKTIACKRDIKGSWEAINEIINKTSKSINIDHIKNRGQEISNNRKIANIMNDYICTVGTDLAKNIEETKNLIFR